MGKTKRFYSYIPEDGFSTHATAEEARDHVQAYLSDLYTEAASDGWPDDIERAEWGECRESVRETKRSPTCPNGADDCDCDLWHSTDFDEYVDYAVLPVDAPIQEP